MEKLLKTRNALKSKKPSFITHDSHKKKRVSPNWRRPKGRQNKVRLHKKGYVRHISTGYGSPKEVRGLSRDGFRQCVVTTKDDIASFDPKTDALIISSNLGDRKREELVDIATEKGFTILNFDADSFKKRLSEKLKSKSSKRKDVLKRRASREKAAKQKKEAKKDDSGSSDDSSGQDSQKEKGSSDTTSPAGSQQSAPAKEGALKDTPVDSSSDASPDKTESSEEKKQEEKKEYDKFLTKGDQK